MNAVFLQMVLIAQLAVFELGCKIFVKAFDLFVNTLGINVEEYSGRNAGYCGPFFFA